MKKRIILSAVLTMVLCFCLIGGATFALFTSESSVNIAVTSGKVNVEAKIEGLEVYSMDVLQTATDNDGNVLFENGGIAKYDATNNELSLVNVAPGDKVEFNIVVANNSNIDIQYKITWEATGELDEALVKYVVNNQVKEDLKNVDWTEWKYNPQDLSKTIKVGVELPISVGNEYQEKSASISFKFEAIQANGVKYLAVEWDGTSDTTWYNDTDTEFKLNNPAQLAGLADLVDGGNDFVGKTIKLDVNMDLANIQFNPIGHSSNGKSFNGVFDGQGHTISNMYLQNDLGAWQYEGEYYGLFAYTNGATIKNVTVADAYISSGRNEAAGVVGNAVDTNFSDITISNSTLIAYNNSAGGVAAECYGECSFNNIIVDSDTVIGPLWGTYDVRLGGVVGFVQSGNKVTFSNITVACQLDAINDVAANYQYWLYRYSGMLIGHVDGVNGVADPTGYVTCENVTVIYGDWVNYHYCEYADLGAGSYNGPGEYKYARVEAGTGTDGIDISNCNHNADESHNVLIVFDQLFGGGQGVSGLKTYDGVTVVYN